jgi:hypothetical protein
MVVQFNSNFALNQDFDLIAWKIFLREKGRIERLIEQGDGDEQRQDGVVRVDGRAAAGGLLERGGARHS